MPVQIGLRTFNTPADSAEDDPSLLAKIGHGALSGLGFIGQTLDKTFGARSIRAALSTAMGDPRWRDMLSVIPFSDTLGITDPNDVVYGRELLEKANILDRNQPGFDWGDVAGFAADVALDPATYIAPLALTKAGSALAKQGMLPKGMGNQVRGVDYLESQLNKLEPVRAGVAAAPDLVPVGSSIAPVDANKIVLEATGQPLVPQFKRMPQRAQPLPRPVYNPAPGAPTIPTPPPAGQLPFNQTYAGAMDDIAAGWLPAPGKYIGDVARTRDSYKILDVVNPVPIKKGVPTPIANPPQGAANLALSQRNLINEATNAATPLRGAIGIGLPFMEPMAVYGTGARTAAALDKLGRWGSWLKATRPITAARYLFDPRVDRAVTAQLQEIAAQIKRPLEEAQMVEMRGIIHDLTRDLEPIINKAPEEIQRLLLNAAEGVPLPANMGEYVRQLQQLDPTTYQRLLASGELDLLKGQFGRINRIGGEIQGMNRQLLEAEQALGIPTQELRDDLFYSMRMLTPLPATGNWWNRFTGQARQAIGGSHTSQLARNELYDNFPGGTAQINDMLRGVDDITQKPWLVSNQRALRSPAAQAAIRENLTREAADLTKPGGTSKQYLMQQELEKQLGQLIPPPKRGTGVARQKQIARQARQLSLGLRRMGRQGPIEAPTVEQWLVAQGYDPIAAGNMAGPLATQTNRQMRINTQARDLADHLRRMDPRIATLEGEDGVRGINFFREDPIFALAFRGAKSAKARSSAEALYKGLPDIAKPVTDFPVEAGAVPVNEVLKRANLTYKNPAGEVVAEQLAAKALNVSPAELKNMAIPGEVANDMTKWLKAYTTPDEVAPVLAAFDAATNMMKGWLTVPFPAFHARNLMTGVFNMWRDDALSMRSMTDALNLIRGQAVEGFKGMKGNPQTIIDQLLREIYQHQVAFTSRAHQTSDVVRTGGGQLVADIKGIPGRVKTNPEAVAKKIADEAFQSGANPQPLGASQRVNTFGTGPKPRGAQTVQKFLSENGLNTPEYIDAVKKATGVQDLKTIYMTPEKVPTVLGVEKMEGFQQWLQGWRENIDLNPTHLAGVSAKGETNTIMKQMRKVGDTAEDWLRISHYMAKRRQGFSAAEAARAVKKYHFDYGDVTSFERSFMKRFIPFYTFSSRNLPPLLSDLATRPAKLAASIRGATLGSTDPDTFVPPYIGESTNIALPGAPDGSARYLASLGMPFEDEMFRALGSLGAGDFQRAWGGVLSGMNPFAKYPVEVASGRQLHTGRELRDLRPSGAASLLSLGNEEYAFPLSQIISNTPAARAVSTVDKLLDDRKGPGAKALNLGTGFRLTDVDLSKQAEISARDVIRDLLQENPGVRTFEDVYVKPEQLATLTPEELEMYQLYKRLQSKSLKRAAAAKEQARIGIPPN